MNYGVHVYYCSKACQQSDWKVHKKICGPKPTGGAAGGGRGPSRPWGLFSSCESMVQNFIRIHARTGLDINMVAPGNNATLLSVASEEGSAEDVRALIAAGADVNKASICEMGFTPLHIAADRGSEPIARALIAAGADVNKANKFTVTPIRMAAQNGHEVVIRALIAAGAVEDEKTKAERHRNAMGQLLQRMSGRSLPAMPRAEGIHAFDPRTGEWVNFGTGTDGLEAMMKSRKDRSSGRE